MKIAALPTKTPDNRCHTETERPRNIVLRAIATLALRFALASLKLWEPRRNPVKIETDEALNQARMAFATINQQMDCQCTSCKCELIVTAFREELVWPSECSDEAREFHAVCEPFTSTEIELLETLDEEYISRTYPAVGRRVQEEIEARHLNSIRCAERVRGMFCTAATRH
jgi:hypothetical protein